MQALPRNELTGPVYRQEVRYYSEPRFMIGKIMFCQFREKTSRHELMMEAGKGCYVRKGQTHYVLE